MVGERYNHRDVILKKTKFELIEYHHAYRYVITVIPNFFVSSKDKFDMPAHLFGGKR